MRRSVCLQLAFRYGATMTLGLSAAAGLGYLVVRETLDRQIDASVMSVASIQAATVADDPAGVMFFHEWNLTPEEAASLKDLNRYLQVWSESGESLLRSEYLAEDLPVDTAALRRAVTGELIWRENRFRGEAIRSVYYPLGRLSPGHARHVLQVAAPLTWRNKTLRRTAFFLVGLVLVVSGGTFVGAWWLAATSLRPVREVIDQAEEIGANTLGRRISAHAEWREYHRLVEVLNTMLGRIDAAFEAQRRFTADAGHELRSPLTALRGELELALRRERSPEEYRRVIDSALEETERLSNLAQNLLTLARSDAGVMQPRRERIDLADRARSTVGRIGKRADERNIRLEVNARGRTTGYYDPELIDRLIWNLLDNAIKFSPPGGRVDVSVTADDGMAVLEVADSGPGIEEEALDSLFDRFVRGDASRTRVEGSGLGLSIVRAIAVAHGGSVTAENRPAGGALFRVRLPRERRATDSVA